MESKFEQPRKNNERFNKDEILKSFDIFEVSRKRDNKDHPRYNDAHQASDYLNDLKTIEADSKGSPTYEKAEHRLSNVSNKDIFRSALLMHATTQMLMPYIQQEISGENSEFGEDIRFFINNSKFLKGEYNKKIFDLFAEPYIYEALNESRKAYFENFIKANPAFSDRLDQLKIAEKEYRDTSGKDFDRILNIRNKIEDFGRMDSGKMTNEESSRFINEFLDKGQSGVGDLNTMKEWLSSINGRKI